MSNLLIYSHRRFGWNLMWNSTANGAFSDALDSAAASVFFSFLSLLFPAALIKAHFCRLGGHGGSRFGIIFVFDYCRSAELL